jgi:hypothetical protein
VRPHFVNALRALEAEPHGILPGLKRECREHPGVLQGRARRHRRVECPFERPRHALDLGPARRRIPVCGLHARVLRRGDAV